MSVSRAGTWRDRERFVCVSSAGSPEIRNSWSRQSQCLEQALHTNIFNGGPPKTQKLRAFWRFQGRGSATKKALQRSNFYRGPEQHVNYEPFGASKAEATPEKGLFQKLFLTDAQNHMNYKPVGLPRPRHCQKKGLSNNNL